MTVYERKRKRKGTLFECPECGSNDVVVDLFSTANTWIVIPTTFKCKRCGHKWSSIAG